MWHKVAVHGENFVVGLVAIQFDQRASDISHAAKNNDFHVDSFLLLTSPAE